MLPTTEMTTGHSLRLTVRCSTGAKKSLCSQDFIRRTTTVTEMHILLTETSCRKLWLKSLTSLTFGPSAGAQVRQVHKSIKLVLIIPTIDIMTTPPFLVSREVKTKTNSRLVQHLSASAADVDITMRKAFLVVMVIVVQIAANISETETSHILMTLLIVKDVPKTM